MVGPRSTRLFTAVLCTATLLAGTRAAAQEPDPPSTDTIPADTAPTFVHPDFVVRALRMPIPARALPYALTVRQPPTAVPTAGLSLAGEVRAIPGLQVHSRYNDALGDRIVMRGFGARSQFGVRGIQVIVDGVPATMPDGQTTLNHLDLSLLDRVEVLRGPAAAAYGNAAGGVLLLDTQPPPVRSTATVGAAAGAGNLVRLRATAGGNPGDLGWIASLTTERRTGFRPHSGSERYQLTGRADGELAGGFIRAVVHGVSYDAENPGSLTLEQFRDHPHQAQAFNVAQRTGEEGRHMQLGLTWERSLEGARLETAVYGLSRDLENPIPSDIIVLDRRAAGARLLVGSQTGRVGQPHWVVGLDAAVQGDDRQNFGNTQGERGSLTLDQAERVTNVAVHGQIALPLVERVRLLVAARYDRVAFSARDRFLTADNPDDSGDRAMDAVSPTAGLRVELSPGISVYGNVSTAFETPTTTELVNRPDGSGGFNQELEPQRTLSYEVGGRATVSSLRFQASAYHARVRDALIPFEVASSPGRQYFRNAGGAVHRGVELLAEATTEGLDLMAAYSRTDAEFTSYTTADASYDGRAVPGVRPWTLELRVVGRPTGFAALELDYQATGRMAADDANAARAPGYQLVGLRATASRLRVGSWEVAPYAGVDNVLDETYVASVVPNAFGERYLEPGPGRALYLGLNVTACW